MKIDFNLILTRKEGVNNYYPYKVEYTTENVGFIKKLTVKKGHLEANVIWNRNEGYILFNDYGEYNIKIIDINNNVISTRFNIMEDNAIIWKKSNISDRTFEYGYQTFGPNGYQDKHPGSGFDNGSLDITGKTFNVTFTTPTTHGNVEQESKIIYFPNRVKITAVYDAPIIGDLQI
jgi:hypothetical protein